MLEGEILASSGYKNGSNNTVPSCNADGTVVIFLNCNKALDMSGHKLYVKEKPL